MKYKAIIFDMDGTIVDSEAIWAEAGHELIRRRNIELCESDIQQLSHLLRGGPLFNSCSIIKKFTNISEPIEVLVEEKIAIARKLYENGIHFMEGFVDFHSKAHTKQLKTAIATNGTADFVDITNRVLNLSKLFGQHVYHMSHVTQAKPAPDIYLYAAKQLGVHPRECIAIEDSAHGIKAAKDAGMFCIGYNSCKTPEHLHQSDLIIDHFNEIELDKLLQ